MSETKNPSSRKGCLIIFAIAWIGATWIALFAGMNNKYSSQDGVTVANPAIVKVLPALIVFAIGASILLVIGYMSYRNRKR